MKPLRQWQNWLDRLELSWVNWGLGHLRQSLALSSGESVVLQDSPVGESTVESPGFMIVPGSLPVVFKGHLQFKTCSAWWFGTFFVSPYIGKNHPN